MAVSVRLVATPLVLSGDASTELDRIERGMFDLLYPKTGSYWWLGRDEFNKPVAYCGLTPYPHLDCAFLCRAGVKKTHRGQGVHQRMIRIRERRAKRDGFGRVVTYTSADNLRSANNLIRMGYQLYEPPNDYGVAHALYFQKHI